MNRQHDPDASARTTLRLIGPDPANWVPDRAHIDHNVTIVGGGQTGCALAFALRRAGIGKVSILEAAADEHHAGIWLNAARMNLLRTPKELTGPELGLPTLSFQAWYEARNGQEAYAAIDRIKRTDWADYLSWYKQFLGIRPRYQTCLKRIEALGTHFRLHLETADGYTTETTRKIILATGFSGGGGKFIPNSLNNLRPALVAHTEDPIDFAALRGKTIGIIGAAASAFDAAGVALENGAAAVHLFARRATIAATPVTRARGFPGAYDNYYQLPDAERWHQAIRYFRSGSTPTVDAIERTVKFANFALHVSSPWTNATERDGKVETVINSKTYRLDFVIAGTGYSPDLASRPELADFADDILLWQDRYAPPDSELAELLGRYPYLGAGHELMAKTENGTSLLKHIHVQNPAGFLSFGLPLGDVPSMKRDIPVVVGRISADLFGEDLNELRVRMSGDVASDFTEDLYRSALR